MTDTTAAATAAKSTATAATAVTERRRHSLALTEAGRRDRYRAAPAMTPFFVNYVCIHL